MNILQVLYSGLGGHGNVAYSFIEGSNNNDNQQLIFYGIESLKPEYKIKASECGAVYRSILKKRGIDISALLKYISCLYAFKPEVIILHSTNLLVPTFFYKLISGSKLLFVEHQSNQAKSKHQWLMSSLSFLLADKVVYLTEEYKREVKARIKYFKEEKTVVIPNGINTNVFRAKEDTLFNPAKVKLLMVSRLNKLRDHYTIIRAAEVLIKKYELRNLVLTIAGDGETLEELKKITKDLRLEQNVKFTGNLAEAEIVKEFHNADIYVHASLAETLSTSILQAMASKLPIVASNITGINNLLIDEHNALLFNNGDYEGLADKILLLSKDFTLKDRISTSALHDVRQFYSHYRMSNSYQQLYK